MAYAPVNYTGDNDETDFTIGFPYVRSGYVVVELDSVVTTAWSFIVSGTKIRFDTPPDTDVEIDISRVTPLVPVVDFEDGAGLPEADLDDVVLQFHHALDETIFNSITGMGKSGAHWTAEGLRIQDVADAVANDEAANLGQLQPIADTAQISADDALVSENAAQSSEDDAQTSEDAAAASEIAAAASATAAALSAANLPDISGGSVADLLRIASGGTAYEHITPNALRRLFIEIWQSGDQGAFTGFDDIQHTFVAGSADANGDLLTGPPDSVIVYIRCTTANLDYSVGDIIGMPGIKTGGSGGFNWGFASDTATTFWVSMMTSFNIANKDSSGSSNITDGSWAVDNVIATRINKGAWL